MGLQMDEKQEVTVIFRKFNYLGDIVALFPYEVADTSGNCMSYQHVGQHGAANYNYCVSASRLANENEYSPLKLELEGLGYILTVKKRLTLKGKKK